MKKRILTGDRPTGKLHLGHYVGSLKQRVALQAEYDSYIMIADVQALTDNFATPDKVHDNVLEVALDYLAVGINPAIATIFIQSQVPELAELTVYFMNLVTVNRLRQNPTVKTEMEQKGFEKELPLGFFAYPVSQTADITAFDADLVPAGADQAPMIELARDIVQKFNQLYGPTLVEPEILLSEFPRLPGTDGKEKMSKSLGNTIYLSDSAEEVEKKISKMYTDPSRVHADTPGTVEGNPVFIYHDAFNPNTEEVAELKARYTQGTVTDVEVKQKLAHAINALLEPMRIRRAEYARDPQAVFKILEAGTTKARTTAQETLHKVRAAMQLEYFK